MRQERQHTKHQDPETYETPDIVSEKFETLISQVLTHGKLLPETQDIYNIDASRLSHMRISVTKLPEGTEVDICEYKKNDRVKILRRYANKTMIFGAPIETTNPARAQILQPDVLTIEQRLAVSNFLEKAINAVTVATSNPEEKQRSYPRKLRRTI